MLTILGSGCITPADMGGLDAILEGESFLERHPILIGTDGTHQLGGFCAPCLMVNDPAKRLCMLIEHALTRVSESHPVPEDTPILIAVPSWLPHSVKINDTLVAQLREALGTRPVELSYGTRCAAADLITAAQRRIDAGAKQVVILAADTLVAPIVLDMRAAQGLSLREDDPYRSIPAEAAAALVLSPAGDATAPALCAIASGDEPETIADPDRGLLGRTATRLVREVLNALEERPVASWITDVNGERHRSEELGMIAARFAAEHPAMEDPMVPALSVGDTGIASGTVALALAAHSPGAHLLTLADNTGPRAALLVTS